MAPHFNQWLKRKFQSSNREILPPPPYCDEWFIIPSSASGNFMPSNYGLFQTLPLEIRQQILGHAFGNQTLHVDLTFDHPLTRKPIRKLWDPSQYKKSITSALVPHRAPPNSVTGLAHCGFGTHLIRDTRQPKQWQWFSCVCHRRVVRLGEGDGPPTRDPRIEPHEDGCIPSRRADERVGHSPKSPTLCQCESTDPNTRTADACFIGVMGWLLACRQAYRDGTDILYGTNTFHFSSLPLLLDLPRLMPPAHLTAITSAELLWTFADPCVFSDTTMYRIWKNYIRPPNPSSPPDPSSPTSNFHRLAAQLPTTLPNVRRLYIALQAHLPPREIYSLPPATTTTTITTQPNTNPSPKPDTRVLAAVEHVILEPIEAAFRRLGLGPDKEFSLAVQRGGWEVFADWLERWEPRGGAKRIFEVFGEAGEGVVSYRERVWKPLLGLEGEERVGYWLCQGWDDFKSLGDWYWQFDLWGTTGMHL